MAAVAALVVLAGRVEAQATDRALTVAVENVTAKDAGRTGTTASAAMPSDVIRYELRFTNPSVAAVRNVVFDNPVPAGMHYEAGSARADLAGVVITYSIDGGRTYSAQPMIEQVVNGERQIVPAPATMYTHVRWTVGATLRPRAQVVAEFRARVASRAGSGDGF